MKKHILFIALAFCLAGSLTSCGGGNSVDSAINKAEKLLNEASEASDPMKKAEILMEAAEVLDGIEEDDVTPEQQERLLKVISKIQY